MNGDSGARIQRLSAGAPAVLGSASSLVTARLPDPFFSINILLSEPVASVSWTGLHAWMTWLHLLESTFTLVWNLWPPWAGICT